MPKATTPAASRFWKKVAITSDMSECWEWKAAQYRNGYGSFGGGGRKGKHTVAHRFAYELAVGPIPDGMVLDHLCKNVACVNPTHLEVTTQRINVLRGTGPMAANARKTACIHGHAFDEANTYRHGTRRYCRTCRERNLAKYRLNRQSASSPAA